MAGANIAGDRVDAALRIVDALEGGWNAIAPGLAAVEAIVEPALVVADSAIVLSSDQVLGVGWVDFDDLFGLAAEAAVLIDTYIIAICALVTAERVVVKADHAGVGAAGGIACSLALVLES